MSRYSMTKCDEIGEVALMEVAEAATRTTRARSAAAKAVVAETGRKRKAAGEFNHSSTSPVQLRNRRRLVVKLNDSKLEKEASSSNDPCASCCSSNGSTELDKETSKLVDLEECAEISTSTYEYESCRERRESTPSSEVQAESGELESTARLASEVNSRRRSTDEKMPSSAELEDFFAAAEKDIQKEYAEKYNFDFVKEQPFEGRYNWVRVKP